MPQMQSDNLDVSTFNLKPPPYQTYLLCLYPDSILPTTLLNQLQELIATSIKVIARVNGALPAVTSALLSIQQTCHISERSRSGTKQQNSLA